MRNAVITMILLSAVFAIILIQALADNASTPAPSSHVAPVATLAFCDGMLTEQSKSAEIIGNETWIQCHGDMLASLQALGESGFDSWDIVSEATEHYK